MKHALKSKTIWFNVLTLIVVFATYFGYVPDKDLAENTTAGLIAMSPFINIFLRFITSTAISFRK